MFQQTKEGISLKVKVIPKSSKSGIKGWENGELVVRLAAVPEKGEANEELIRYLADFLGIAKSRLQLVQGEKSRHKRVCIKGLSMEELKESLQKEPGIGKSISI